MWSDSWKTWSGEGTPLDYIININNSMTQKKYHSRVINWFIYSCGYVNNYCFSAQVPCHERETMVLITTIPRTGIQGIQSVPYIPGIDSFTYWRYLYIEINNRRGNCITNGYIICSTCNYNVRSQSIETNERNHLNIELRQKYMHFVLVLTQTTLLLRASL